MQAGKKNYSQNNYPGRPGGQGKYYLAAIYFIVFCAFFDTHAQMPVLAPYAVSLGAGPFVTGLVVGAYSLFNITGNFSGGAAIDRKDWRLPLLIGLIGVTAALFFYTIVNNASQLVIVRAAHGFMGGFLVPSALAALMDGENEQSLQRKRMAVFGATIGLAAVSGPMAAGIIAGVLGYKYVYYFLVGLMLLASLTAISIRSGQSPDENKQTYSPVSPLKLLKYPELRGSFIFALGTMGATGTLAAFLPTRAELIGLDHARTGMLFATFAFTAIVIQMLWPGSLRQLIRKDCRACAAGQLLMAVALIIASIINVSEGLFLAMFIFGTGFGFSFQGMLGLVAEGSQPERRGRAIGSFFAFYSLGAALIPPFGGLIWQQFNLFPFYIAALTVLLAMIYGRRAVSTAWTS